MTCLFFHFVNIDLIKVTLCSRTDPEYYNLVEKPIDLMKIQSKLKNEEYEDIDDMTEDIALIVANAKTFYSVSFLYWRRFLWLLLVLLYLGGRL